MNASPHPPTPALHVVGLDDEGGVVASFRLAHGADPVGVLLEHGWVAHAVVGVDTVSDPGHALTLRYAVQPASEGDLPRVRPAVPTDEGLVTEAGEQVHPYQRAAAYGLVTSNRGILLTQLSEATNAAGRWTLPGGGIDPGESPLEALHREVWEESGQRIGEPDVLDIHTQHWVGRAPSGRLEDFHAVRIIFTAHCPTPTDPVVHDVGGSTAAVRWVRREEVSTYRLTRSFAPHLQTWLEL